MKLLSDCHRSSLKAEAAVRRTWNRALFKAIYVAEGQIKSFDYQEPLGDLFFGRVQITDVW